MALWLYGFMALWLYGFMALWLYGFVSLRGGATSPDRPSKARFYPTTLKANHNRADVRATPLQVSHNRADIRLKSAHGTSIQLSS